MSLDALAKGVMRKVPCPACRGKGHPTYGDEPGPWPACLSCRGTGVTLDPRSSALREALWTECPGDEGQIYGHWVEGKFVHYSHCWSCHGTGFVRRSRAEAALRLFDATHSLGWEPQMANTGRNAGWIADVFPNEDSNFHGTGPTAEDALADAVEAALRAEVRMSTREIP